MNEQNKPNRLNSLKQLFILAIVVSVALMIIGFIFGVIVRPGMMAVRQINFGPGQGISKEGLEPGLYLRIPFYSDVLFVPQSVQIIEFHREQDGDAGDHVFRSLEIQTSDRATVDVDVSVFYHFFRSPGVEDGAPHGGPHDLLTSVGVNELLWVNKVRRVADDALKRSLGRLATNHFYDPVLREQELKNAIAYMNKGDASVGLTGLLQYGIVVESILLRRYTYREERIENAIFQKNLQDQEEALNVAEGKLAEAQARLANEEAKGEAKNQTLRTEGEENAKVIRSEAELYEAKKRAEADLEVAKARAETDRLKATVLSRGLGAQVYVAREMIPTLKSLKGGVVSGVDPYNMDGWMKRFGFQGGKGQ